MELPIKRLDAKAIMPSYAHEGDAGLDLHSLIDITIKPFERTLIPTGFALSIPEGYAGLVLPRSGLSSKTGLTLINAPGLIDSGYRGEVKISVVNLDANTPVAIKAGDRIAQLLITPYLSATLKEFDSLDESQRGEGGFGSSGL